MWPPDSPSEYFRIVCFVFGLSLAVFYVRGGEFEDLVEFSEKLPKPLRWALKAALVFMLVMQPFIMVDLVIPALMNAAFDYFLPFLPAVV